MAWKKGLIMDHTKARKMFELATRLSSVNASDLNEQQLAERNSMIARLQEEMKKIKEDSGRFDKKELSPGRTQYTRKSDSYTDGGGSGPEYSLSMPSRKIDDDNDREYNLRDEDDEDIEEANAEQTPHYNVNKLGQEIGIDPRQLRVAIQRSITGNPTRQDTLTVANAFISILKNGDDQTIQNIANIIKAGNPKTDVPQESTASIAERNAFVDAMRQVKKGEKFTVGGKEFTKTTTHGTGSNKEEVKEEISTEAYDRLKRVFDFSNYKG